jgi:RHS repeat-associated protein
MHDRFGQAHADSSTPGTWDGQAYYHTDQIGSNRMMTDGTPSTVREYVYDAFGNVYETSGSADTRYRYVGASGYESHDDFPFLHLGARYYDPETGRFLQRDPIGLRGGLNAYQYAAGKPAVAIDPDGLASLHPTTTPFPFGPPKPTGPPDVGMYDWFWTKVHWGYGFGMGCMDASAWSTVKLAIAWERFEKDWWKESWANRIGDVFAAIKGWCDARAFCTVR